MTIISEVKQYNGFFYQEFCRMDGNLEAVRLYDKEGWFVAEFPDLQELKHFVDTVEVLDA